MFLDLAPASKGAAFLEIKPRVGTEISEKVTKIVWKINGKTLTDSEVLAHSVLAVVRGDYSFLNYYLGSGTHKVEALVTSPNICPGGITLNGKVVIP
ncbi:hypothetical protein [Aquimarina agarilytica]|uniref:hypothetical protein n=1 Tax=Aquimarina agarilytica TaxID=1087449 RepID=UPI000288D6CC|nr:hypothetical protein [Aquimarina agarilytica]